MEGDGDGNKCHLPKLPPSGEQIQSKSGALIPNEIAMITLTTGDKINAKRKSRRMIDRCDVVASS